MPIDEVRSQDREKEKSALPHSSYLCVVHHVYSLEYNTLGVITKELQDVLHLGLVREASQSDAVPPRA